MPKPIECTEVAYEYARRLVAAQESIAHELGATGSEVTQGAAIFAGVIARSNAKPGFSVEVGAVSAAIVAQLAGGTRN